MQYAEALLRLQKQVFLFSPDWFELNEEFQVRYREQASRIQCFNLDAYDSEGEEGFAAFAWRILHLRNQLRQAERKFGIRVDLAFFAPADDWVRPGFSKLLFQKFFPFNWSGILTQTADYEEGKLPLKVDPGFGDRDYLFSAGNCIGLATLDRFRTESIRSRIYRRVVVMPDVSDLTLPSEPGRLAQMIRKMARDRMVVGTLILEGENPTHFLELANQASPEQYFFVCYGRFDTTEMQESTHEQLKGLLESGRNNSYFVLEEPGNSLVVNELVSTFDVCYLNLGDAFLPHPLLTKAAAFGKPVIGSKGDMVGKILKAFGTGITVNGVIKDSLQALTTLRLQQPFETNFDQTPLKNYAQLQDAKSLRDAWEELLCF